MSALAGVNERETSSFQMKIGVFEMSAKLADLAPVNAPFWHLCVSRSSTKFRCKQGDQANGLPLENIRAGKTRV